MPAPSLSTDTANDPRLLRLHASDNVLVARADIAADEAIRVAGATVVTDAAIRLGHKLAARPIRAGEKVLKYGAAIGTATAAIAAGAHVHLHNLRSDYTASIALEGASR